MISPDVTLIIKVTNACNMRCRYCFIEPSVFHKTMARDTARRVVRAFLDSSYFQSVQFVWHGGEPLLRGRDFFEEILQEQRRRPTRVAFSNSTQTNATRLDDEMMDFLLGNGFGIGLSMDGSAAVNDNSRQLRMVDGHQSAHAVTVDAARRLSVRGQQPAAIVVINKNNVGEPEEVYRGFKAERIHMKLNALTRSGLADTALGADLAIGPEEWGRFMVRLFDLWYDDPEPTINIEPFRQHIGRMLGVPTTHSCFFTRSCHHFFLGISPDGDVFPCGMFQGEPSFRYGNIFDMAPEEVADTLLFKQIEDRERRVLETCAKCAFYDLCYSGCMFHSLKDSKVLAEKDYYCAGYKQYFEHVLRRVHADLQRAAAVARDRSATPPAGAS
jgi:serine-type anaerobic sulfatase-maturating enzyme